MTIVNGEMCPLFHNKPTKMNDSLLFVFVLCSMMNLNSSSFLSKTYLIVSEQTIEIFWCGCKMSPSNRCCKRKKTDRAVSGDTEENFKIVARFLEISGVKLLWINVTKIELSEFKCGPGEKHVFTSSSSVLLINNYVSIYSCSISVRFIDNVRLKWYCLLLNTSSLVGFVFQTTVTEDRTHPLLFPTGF